MRQIFVLELLVFIFNFDCYGLLSKPENGRASYGACKRSISERFISQEVFSHETLRIGSSVLSIVSPNELNARRKKGGAPLSTPSSSSGISISNTPELITHYAQDLDITTYELTDKFRGRAKEAEELEKDKSCSSLKLGLTFSPINSISKRDNSSKLSGIMNKIKTDADKRKKEESKPKKTATPGAIAMNGVFSKSTGNLKESIQRLSSIKTEIENGIECYLFIRYNKSIFILQKLLDMYNKGQEIPRTSLDSKFAQDLLRYHINALTDFCSFSVSKDDGKIFDYKKYDRFYRKFCSQVNICLPILVSCLKKDVIEKLENKIEESCSVISEHNEIFKERNIFLENTLNALQNEVNPFIR